MCCLFGILDYGQSLNSKQLNKMVAVLSKACEVRGTDATGIAYNYNGKLCIFKRPLPAHRMHYRIPDGVHYVMGHTRMTTQGNEKFNYNNHPFLGETINTDFALAHNGVLYNDEILKIREHLPETKIETDSYVAVQLIEKKRTLNADSLKFMAEQLEGSFTITVMDKENNLYFVKGDNPMCIFKFDNGFYIYASTEEILLKAIGKMHMSLGKYKKIDITCGDILTIDKYGNIGKATFETDNLAGFSFASYYWRASIPTCEITSKKIPKTYQEEYIEQLKSEAEYCGYSPVLIDSLLSEGFSADDIENMIFYGEY